MNAQQMADRFARTAKPRFAELLRLKAQHFYDPTPGDANSTSFVENVVIRLKMATTRQPYVDIERFVNEEKEMGFIINPGLVPLVKAIASDARGRSVLVTRQIAVSAADPGVAAHLDGFGVRITIRERGSNEVDVIWQCLYGAA